MASCYVVLFDDAEVKIIKNDKFTDIYISAPTNAQRTATVVWLSPNFVGHKRCTQELTFIWSGERKGTDKTITWDLVEGREGKSELKFQIQVREALQFCTVLHRLEGFECFVQ